MELSKLPRIFISHATEDKEPLVRPLAEKLKKHFEIWYDEHNMVLGDVIPEQIGRGLKNCDFGLVVLSKMFFTKNWTRSELAALISGENSNNTKILPIWHGVSYDEVYSFSPFLASKLAVTSDVGVDEIVNRVIQAVSGKKEIKSKSAKINDQNSAFQTLNTGRALSRASGEAFLETGIEEEFNNNNFNTFTIAMIDIDDLTQINSRFGRHVGDKVISRVCLLLSKEVPNKYPVGRCGDDTFFALFWGLAENKSRQNSLILMDKLRNFKWSKLSKKLWVTSSIGFSVHDQMEPVRDTIIRAAQAMISAKEKGKNRVEEASEHLSSSDSREFRYYYS